MVASNRDRNDPTTTPTTTSGQAIIGRSRPPSAARAEDLFWATVRELAFRSADPVAFAETTDGAPFDVARVTRGSPARTTPVTRSSSKGPVGESTGGSARRNTTRGDRDIGTLLGAADDETH